MVESSRSDGLTDLRVVDDHGQTLATYPVDLKHHHEPATSDDGPIRQWETWRFGAFVSFNDNQFVGKEYSDNADVANFNPIQLDMDGCASVMKRIGMKYVVLTTRHTSGFLLWDSATSTFDSAASPAKTDVVVKFVAACRRHDIAPGLYYCMWGGNQFKPHPNARAIILAQLHELASKYGKIPYFWIDMKRWGPANLSTQEIYDAIKNDQPDAIVIFNQHIQDGSEIRYFPSDVINGEVHVPPAEGHEAFRMINGKRYYMPFEFEPVSQRRTGRNATRTPLGHVGVWFTYGAGRSFEASKSLPAATMFDWIKTAYDRGASDVLLSLAPDYTGSMRAEDVAELEKLGVMLREAGLLNVPAPATLPREPLSLNKPVEASGVWRDDVNQYGPAKAFDGNRSTRWAGAEATKSSWLQVDLGEPLTISDAQIREGWDRTRRFAVQYKVGDQWKDAAVGTTIGAMRRVTFEPVKARMFRLNILESTDAPTIWEFQLFAPAQP